MTINQMLRVIHRLAEAHEEQACWPWPLGRQRGKYGRLNWRGESEYAHRAVCEALIANPAGLVVCHTCDNPICVNPSHLFVGTQADNNVDKALKGRNVNPLTDELKRRTRCPEGHPYDDANTLHRTYTDKSGRIRRGRACRACLKAWQRGWKSPRVKAS